MKKLLNYGLALPLFAAGSAFAQDGSVESWHAKTLPQALGNSALFGLVGIVMVIIGFKLFDKVITRIDLEDEIKKGNVAASILAAGAIIAIGLIVAASIS